MHYPVHKFTRLSNNNNNHHHNNHNHNNKFLTFNTFTERLPESDASAVTDFLPIFIHDQLIFIKALGLDLMADENNLAFKAGKVCREK